MEARIEAEFELLRSAYPAALYKDDWILLPDYPLPPGWSQAAVDVATYLRPGYPGTHPYGIYVCEGLLFEGQPPNNYTCPANPKPPFEGMWGILSWEPEKKQWQPASDPAKGHNLLTWVSGFQRRFKEGR
jgi:hypothetical protein